MIVKKSIGKLPVLIGEYDSTKTYDKKNRVTLYGSEFESLMDSNTYAPATYNSDTKAVTFDTEHWKVVSNGTGAWLAGEKLDQFSFEENPEFVSAEVDNDGKLLESTNVEGNKTIYGDLEVKGDLKNEGLPEQIKDATKDKVDKEDGKSLINENVASSISVEDNPEFISVHTDSDNKIIDAVKEDGTVEHNTKHVFKGGLEDSTGGLKEEALQYAIDNSSDLAKALKEGGYLFSATDWSDYVSNDGDNPLNLPEPDCAIINIITAGNIDLTKIDKAAYSSKSDEGIKYNVPVEIQYWDKKGNYFRKKAYISGQGDSSRMFPQKNIACDFFDSDYNGDAFSIKFGKWVAQDSFHFKAYHQDFIKGSSIIAYKFADMVENYGNTCYNNKPWKRALINEDDIKYQYDTNSNIIDLDNQLDTGALCHPDGFPVIVYQNSAFYAIFAWALKKHRDNYHMSKSNAKHIQLDGVLYLDNIWNGTVNWTAFEIRNPKNLYYKEAQTDKEGNSTYEYDADIAQAEIAGDDEVNAWIEAGQLPDGTIITSKIEKNLQNTANVKNYILALSKYKSEIEATSTDDDKKTLIEKYFDLESVLKYEIVQYCVCDSDGYGKNWQWVTYDGIKWAVCEYDKDMSFGNNAAGMCLSNPWGMSGYSGRGSIFNVIIPYYKDELLTMTKNLIAAGIISKKTLCDMVMDWVNRIGFNNYEKYYNKWTEAPCNRDDGVDNNNWKRVGKYLDGNYTYSSSKTYSNDDIVVDTTNHIAYQSLADNNAAALTDTSSWKNIMFDENNTYAVGEKCALYLFSHIWLFEAVAENNSNPIIKTYSLAPQYLGYRDNLWRYMKFINYQIDAITEWANK